MRAVLTRTQRGIPLTRHTAAVGYVGYNKDGQHRQPFPKPVKTMRLKMGSVKRQQKHCEAGFIRQ